MPVAIASQIDEIVEARSLFATAERPITFDEFLSLFGPKDDVELIDGVAQKRMAARLDHEWLLGFLYHLIAVFAEDNSLGLALSSRTAVRIGQFRGRLPDLLFVRQGNVANIEQAGLRFAPDLVIEIISPGDRISDIVALQTDYRNIGVPEIVFIDQRRQSVRVLRLQSAEIAEAEYEEQILGTGESVRLSSLGVSLPVDWLFQEPRPTVLAALEAWQNPPTTI